MLLLRIVGDEWDQAGKYQVFMQHHATYETVSHGAFKTRNGWFRETGSGL
jgi:hypothetical protein